MVDAIEMPTVDMEQWALRLNKEVADLQRQLAEVLAQSERFCDKYLASLKRAETAEAENEQLREALEPFANRQATVAGEIERPTLEQVRAVRAALEGAKGAEK